MATTYGPFLGAAGVRKLITWVKNTFLGKNDQAASAAKLGNTTAVGSASKPTYFNASGVPVAVDHELNADVPADAKFTDTTYAAATTAKEGLMSAADKVKVDGLGTAASANTESAVANDAGLPTGAAVQSYVTGLGYQTSTQVESAITGKGYQTASDVESAITGKGYQTSAQVESAITGKGYQTASDVESAIGTALGSVYTVKGSVDSYDKLPTNGRKTGDVWNVVAAYGDYPAGTNWVFDGSSWDALGGAIDLSGYVQSSEITEMDGDAVEAILNEA